MPTGRQEGLPPNPFHTCPAVARRLDDATVRCHTATMVGAATDRRIPLPPEFLWH